MDCKLCAWRCDSMFMRSDGTKYCSRCLQEICPRCRRRYNTCNCPRDQENAA